MTERPDDGYRAQARIEVRSTGWRRVVTFVIAAIVIGWAGTVAYERIANGPQVPRTVGPIAIGPFDPAPTVATPTDRDLRPAVEVELPHGPVPPIGLRLGGLAWLDPEAGRFTVGPDPAWAQWLFATADGGTVCACLEPASGSKPGNLYVVRFSAAGGVGGATSASPWPPSGKAGPMDVALTPDERSVVVATATTDGNAWSIAVHRVSIGGFDQTQTQVIGTVPTTLVGADAFADLRIWLSPDGSQGRVRFSTPPPSPQAAPRPEGTWIWLFRLPGQGVRQIRSVSDPWPELDGTRCPAEAWASERDFVRVCRQPLPDQGGEEIVVRRESTDGTTGVVSLGQVDDEAVGWLIDGHAGLVYGWASLSHRAWRVDVAADAATSRTIEDPTATTSRIEAARPEPGPGARWQRASAASPAGPLAGSRDGSLLYAAGRSFDVASTGGGPASTGIWVLDARTLAVVDHWLPAADYGSIALTADDRYLLASGSPTPAERAAVGNHGPLLLVHDATAGGAVAVVARGIVAATGDFPTFLEPPGVAFDEVRS